MYEGEGGMNGTGAGHGGREDVFLRRAAGPEEVEDLLCACAPEVLAAFVGRFGDFDLCEEVFQEVLVAAAREWPERGSPPTSAVGCSPPPSAR